MRRVTTSLLCILAVLAVAPLRADPTAEVRLVAEDPAPVWVGEPKNVYLELWTSELSFSAQSFVLPEVPGGFLMQPDSTTVKLSERREGTDWQGLRYYLALYPQRAGPVEIPSFDVRFSTSSGYGSEPTAHTFSTEPLPVTAQTPPGADPDSLLVSTSGFRLQGGWEPVPSEEGAIELETGDALVLDLRREADNVPGMVFSPLPEIDVDGLGVYTDAPEVNDRVNRGQLTGTRRDRVTLVCETPGRYLVPAFRFQWWDPGAERMHEEEIPQLTLNVTQNPAWAVTPPGESESRSLRPDARWAWAALAAALLWWPGWPLARAIGKWFARELKPRRLKPLNPP